MKKFLVILILISAVLSAQEKNKEQILSGSLAVDSYLAFEETKPELTTGTPKDRKSPLLAGFMSAVVPGAGEFYNGDYWKSALFFGIEVAAITTSIIYNQKGDDQTDVFEAYAHEHWSADRYANWIYDNVYNFDAADDKVTRDELFPGGNLSWKALHRVEDEIPTYSHNLERFGHQQYYEMIGKYKQFSSGWDDFKDEYHTQGTVSPNFTYYSGERGEANDLYNIASKAVVIVVINHVASAIDAAWSASRYNKQLDLKMSLEKEQIGFKTDLYPQMNIKFNF